MRQLSGFGWAAAIGAVLAVAVLEPDRGDQFAALSGSDLPAAMTAVTALGTEALATWILLVVTTSWIAPRSGLLRCIAPRAFRVALIRQAVMVSAVGALAITPAHASSGESANESLPAPTLAGLQLPDRPHLSSHHLADSSSRQQRRSSPDRVIVQSGDTLWSIAATRLPADASVADIATSVQQWHRVNRAVIGTDPDLIFPQQRLTPPPKESA